LWSFGDGNSSTAFDPSHTYASAGTYTVTLLSKNVSGCESTASASVVVNAMPKAAFTASTECVGNATVFTNTSSISSGTMSYDWDFGDGTGSTSAIPNKTYGSAGTYLALLTVTSNNGCVSAKGVSVKVHAKPTASIAGTDVCIGTATNFSNYTTGATKYSWTFGDGNTSTAMSPSNTYKSAGTYSVQMTATNAEGCSDVTSTSVSVYAVPTVSFSQTSQCVGTAMSFTNGSSTGNNNWTFGDGYTSTSANPSHVYNMSGNFNVTLKVTNGFGCSSELTKAVTVYAAPTAGFTATEVCRGSATTFSNSSTGATGYAWAFGDGGTSTSANPSYTYGAAGTYTVSMVATSANGCSSTYASSVVVNATPTASFGVNEACANSVVSFSNTSSAGVNSWTFGDGAGSQMANPSHVYTTANTYNVVLTVTNGDGCVASSNRNVTINPLPVVSFTGSALCTGPAAQFTNGTTVPGGTATSAWNFGDGNTSNQTSPSHTYGSAGTYNVRLTATTNKGCVATTNNSITVYTAPKADFSAAGVCAGSTTQFNNMSSGAATSSWNFGDGQTSTDVFPSHKYAGQGSFNVKLIASNAIGCTNEVTKTVSVYAIPTASFTAANGCEGTAMTFNNTSTGATTSTWNYGDGNSSVGTNGMHTYSGSGSRMISLMVESANGCSNETTRTIDVYARPYASFTMSNTCEGDLTKFTNTSQNGSNYAWDFGDAGTSNIENPTHQYTASGAYTAKLTVMNANCSNVYSMPFTINAAPDAGFSVAKNGRDAKFTANSQVNVSKYEWDFNDGSTSNEANPDHVYQKAVVQTFKVCLKVTDLNGCASESCKDVMVDIVSAKDVEMNGLAIYPNPTNGTIYINLGQNNGKVSIELMDMVGKTVKMVDTSMGGLNFRTDISDMAEGVYLVKVKNGTLETTQRIVLSK
jgi:PKD repeat protein